MATAEQKPVEGLRLKGPEKAAALLLFLGEQISAEVMRNLDDDEIHEVVKTIAIMTDITPEMMDVVVTEFNRRIIEEGYMSEVGKDFVEKVVKKALPNQRATHVLKRLSYIEKLEDLKKYDARTIFNLISKEHPQVIAFVCSHLPTALTTEIIGRLPEDMQYEVIKRIARMEHVIPGTMEEVIDSLVQDISSYRVGASESTGGVKPAAEIVNSMKKATANEIMRKVEEEDPDLAEEIGSYMFVFEDLLNVDDRGIQTILKEVSNDDLVGALKMASDEVKNKIFRNISSRAAEMIQEDLDVRGPMRLTDVEKAQQAIIRIARKLEQEGKIYVQGRGGEETFV
ncbi:MAG: flagellar motor switch protein FliG [Deltaproteobacteria bacterium]|nr:flagellar motor switch protein FliG [bacterium]MCB9478203.1 flagellar motor switch protein FliG [Deltaproteobacteria bacterium]MCB9487244.1 flagellar motor switch protein FliG [Deltaproteobacteria bacterium]